ncbi:MAG TPA: hypothetical protein VMF57_04185 [Solirubrobacteraceae bacterium]|nr:hypothetical protein [Solirubrobacteraceae bacterium]
MQAPDGAIWKVATSAYVEVATPSSGVMISGDAGPFTDPDGFAWEAGAV